MHSLSTALERWGTQTLVHTVRCTTETMLFAPPQPARPSATRPRQPPAPPWPAPPLPRARPSRVSLRSHDRSCRRAARAHRKFAARQHGAL
eukprot:4391888-Prymnesium_polylepis.1